MRRLTRGRAATDDEVTPPESGASEAVGAAPSRTAPVATGDHAHAGESEAVTIVEAPGESGATGAEGSAGEATEPADRDLPAGLDPARLAASAGSARRGRIRRRLSYLRHARELLLRDLGGFYYEAHRSEGGAAAHARLLDVKARRMVVLDAEVRELEERLSEDHPQAILREPGIGGTCPQCGELHGSDARFCPRCGTPLARDGRRHEGTAAPGRIPPVEEQGRATTASLWGRRRTSPPPDPTEADPQAGREEEQSPAAGGNGASERKGGEEAARGDEDKGAEAPAEERPT